MDVAIFKDIAFFLGQAYANHVQIGGILYLHRITDNRASGTAMRSFQLLHKICGSNGAKFTSLVTTMWDQIPVDSNLYNRAVEREQELRSTKGCWGWMSDHRSRIQRCMATKASALSILSSLLTVSDIQGPVVFRLQQELIDENKDLDDTTAGIEMSKHHGTSWQRLKQELKTLQTAHQLAILKSDIQLDQQVRAQKLDIERLLEVAEANERGLRQEVESVFAEKTESYRNLFIRTRKDVTDLSNEIEMLKEVLERVEDNSDQRVQALDYGARVSPRHNNREVRQRRPGLVRRHSECCIPDSEVEIASRLTRNELFSSRELPRRSHSLPRSRPRSQRSPQPSSRTKVQKTKKPEYLIAQMSEEERREYLEKELAKKQRQRIIKRNTLSILGMLGGAATIAAGAITLQIPVVAAGIALFGTAGMKLDLSRKKKKSEEEGKEWQVSEHD
ncbi:hypothetical protein NW762_005490 [Fusarium torreyae]|uniref:Uncharacterized protein n=1 Tax=Fusarium torreyae TaxID=1237075 RepID=A0A9W8S2N1_9HYPO|nr:hypothetical protein NW762_005490 [Fusarium torreyae]